MKRSPLKRGKPLDRRKAPLRSTGFGKRGDRKPLKRRKPKRKPRSPITPSIDTCWLAQFDQGTPCDFDHFGLMRCHLLKEQFLRDDVGLSIEQRWAPEWWMPGCAGHHTRFDDGKLRIPREALPEAFELALDRHPRAAARATTLYGSRPPLIARADSTLGRAA